MAMRAARREPASPPRDKPMSVWVCRSRSVVRARGATNPGRRSAKMRRGHSDCGHTKRRMAIRSRTHRPRQGRSSSRRVYRLWIRRVSQPQRGQAAVGAVVARWTVRLSTSRQAWMRRLPAGAPSRSSESNTRLRRWGSRWTDAVRGYSFYDRGSSKVREIQEARHADPLDFQEPGSLGVATAQQDAGADVGVTLANPGSNSTPSFKIL